jgi:hypothetical protein
MLDERQGAQDEKQNLTATLKDCLHSALLGESQNFRSWVAASHREFKKLQQRAFITTALACLFSFLILAASLWQAHRITRSAAVQLNQITASADAFADLRQANWKPVGKVIAQNGRTFTELKATK